MDFIQLQAMPQHRQAGLSIILALGTPGFEIQEQPGQSRIVEGMTIVVIQSSVPRPIEDFTVPAAKLPASVIPM